MKRLGLAALLVIALAACNDAQPSAAPPASTPPTSSTPSPSPSATQTPGTGLREAVQAYSDAFLSGDGESAYAMLSERCQQRMKQADFVHITTIARDVYGGKPKAFVKYRERVAGGLARVTYTFDISTLNQRAEPWVREAGAWHEDDC